MIIRASDAIRRAVLKVPDSGPKLSPIPGAFPEKTPDLSDVVPIIPDWFKTMLYDGNVIVIDRMEYYDLPPEVVAHLEVLSH